MSDAGRKRWWRAALIAVLGGGTVLGGWVGLSRSAPSDPPAPPLIPVIQAADAGSKSAPQPVAATAPESAVVPAIPEPAGLPVIPLVPAIPNAPPADVTPASLPTVPTLPAVAAVPVAPPELPALPALPGTEQKKPVEPAVAPATPVLLPPSIDSRTPPVTPTAPPPLPAKTSQPGPTPSSGNADSRLQGPNAGNSVKTEKSGGSVPPVAPVLPVAPPSPDPMIPALPGFPAVGAPGEAPGTPVERARPGEHTRSKPEGDSIPVPNSTVLTPGDLTVRIPNESIAAAVIGGMLLAPATPAPAAQFSLPLPTKIDQATDIADLKKQADEANKKLADIQRDLKQLTELLNGRKDKDGFPIETSPGLVTELKKLTDRLARVEEDLGKMKTQTALRPGSTGSSTPSAVVDPRAGKGTVRVVNEYPVQISIVVNGTSYRVAPTKSLDVDVPAGEFSYQLLESGAASTKSVIKEKETVTLRIK